MATIAENLLALSAAKSFLAAHLVSKGVSAAATEPLQDLVDKVMTISSSDTSDATATADDIAFGKTAYLATGKTTGTYNPEKTISEQKLTVPTPPTISVATAVAAI